MRAIVRMMSAIIFTAPVHDMNLEARGRYQSMAEIIEVHAKNIETSNNCFLFWSKSLLFSIAAAQHTATSTAQ